MSGLTQNKVDWSEEDRLAALDRYSILDTAAEPEFDDIVRIAAQICAVPMALISLVDDKRQWFKAALGLEASETPREIAFCAHAIQQDDVFLVRDATKDARFANNPLVTDDPSLRFYAGAPLRTPDGFPLGTLCVLDRKPGEITEDQRQSLEALARQVMTQLELRRALATQKSIERQFEQFAQAMPNQAWTALPDGALNWFNTQVYDYGGLALGSLDGQAWTQVVHQEDLPAAGERWAAALASGQPYETQFRLRNADGVYRWHLARAVPVRSEDGAIIRWIGTNTDIEGEKTTAEALAHLNATLEDQVAEQTADRNRMWRLSTDLLLVADFEATITAVNPAWASALGWMEKDLIGRSFMDLVHPEDVAVTLAEVGKLAEGATTFKFENRYQHRDGSYRALAWTAVPDHRRIHAIARDVTAEREAAAALARTEEALRQSQKMEAVGQLTGGIAHDFNNMLAVVIGSLDLLKRRIEPQDARANRYVDAASDGARRAALLTQRLLAFSRLQPLKPEAINPNKLVSGMSDLLRHALGSDVRLEVVLAGGLWQTSADPNQLENVILNLAVNARDAMPEGGRLTIETQNAHLDSHYASANGATAGQYVMIAVSDTGSGMPAEVIAKAFDPFFTTKPVGKGTGLGLSQVYGFIRQSGGHVKIYSEPGEGTAVKVYLPRLIGDYDSAPADPQRAVLTRGDQGDLVLVVEDEPSVRQFSVDALSELGYQVIEADGAAKALQLLDANPGVALLFTDIVMPDVNGRKLADEARRRRPDLKVLFTTGYTRNAVVHNGVLDPGVHLIGKPYSVDDLATKVRAVLDETVA